MGRSYIKLNQYIGAVKAYKRAIKVKPDYAEAYNNLGVAYGGLGFYTDAIEAYRQAIKIKPENSSAYLNLGIMYLVVENKEDAIEQYDILKSMDQDLAKRLFDLIHE
jgi:Flp pilus assembly protein TadD